MSLSPINLANSLSDIYAMGGYPLCAVNVVCFSSKKLGLDTLQEILGGGLDILKEAGVALVGGHSIDDQVPKYGLSVLGQVEPAKMMLNSNLQPGMQLVLTKAVGTGVIATALKADKADSAWVESMVESMCALNRDASQVAVKHGVKSCTDVTGFGLAGHLVEMARASQCKIRFHCSKVPLLPGCQQALTLNQVPGGTKRNQEFFKSFIKTELSPEDQAMNLIFDPQTSGGLILGVVPEKITAVLADLRSTGIDNSVIIGEVVSSCLAGQLEVV